MADTRSSADIERDIDRERAKLTGTLRDLQDRVSLEAGLHQAADLLRRNGGEIAASLGRSVRQNPLALGLAGVGLAWLILGPAPGREPLKLPRPDRRDRDDPDLFRAGRTWGPDDAVRSADRRDDRRADRGADGSPDSGSGPDGCAGSGACRGVGPGSIGVFAVEYR